MLALGPLPLHFPALANSRNWPMAQQAAAIPASSNDHLDASTSDSTAMQQVEVSAGRAQVVSMQLQPSAPSRSTEEPSSTVAHPSGPKLGLYHSRQEVPDIKQPATEPGPAAQPSLPVIPPPMPSPHTNTSLLAMGANPTPRPPHAVVTHDTRNMPAALAQHVHTATAVQAAGTSLKAGTHSPTPGRTLDAASSDVRNVELAAVTAPVSSQYHGVTWYKASKRWQARLCTGRRQFHLGYFKSELEAAKAYDRAMLQHAGPGSSQLNFPDEAAAVLESIKEEQHLMKTQQPQPASAKSRPDSGALLHNYRHKPPHRGPHMLEHASPKPAAVRPNTASASLASPGDKKSMPGASSGAERGSLQKPAAAALPPTPAAAPPPRVSCVAAHDVTASVLEAAAGQPAIPGVYLPATGEFIPAGLQGSMQVYEYVWDGSQLQLQRALVGTVGPAACSPEQLLQQQLLLLQQQQREVQQQLLQHVQVAQPTVVWNQAPSFVLMAPQAIADATTAQHIDISALTAVPIQHSTVQPYAQPSLEQPHTPVLGAQYVVSGAAGAAEGPVVQLPMPATAAAVQVVPQPADQV